MGLTITISKRAELRVTTSRIKITLRCLQRSLILILLGLMLNSIHSKSLNDLRFPGVLQLLAISYFVCATLETIFMKPHTQVYKRYFCLAQFLHIWDIYTKNLLGFVTPVWSICIVSWYIRQLAAVADYDRHFDRSHFNYFPFAYTKLSKRLLGTRRAIGSSWELHKLYCRCSWLHRQIDIWKSYV